MPFVFSNFAMTADGKIAFCNREFIPFGSDRDRNHMMELRATADAVMAGARTVETPGVTLGIGGEKFRRLRLSRRLNHCHLRIIVSGNGSMNPRAEIFNHRFSPIIILASERISRPRLRQLRAVADEVKIFGGMEVDFHAALRWLRRKWDVKRLLCEGGGTLHGAMVSARLVDELHLTICPKIFGGSAAPTLADGHGFLRLADAATFKPMSMKRIGDEFFVVFAKAKNAHS